jgi:hypothetical protein
VRLGLVIRTISSLALGACDVVWGISGEPPACDLDTDAFATADMTDLKMAVDDYSVSIDNDRVIGTSGGIAFEIEIGRGGDPTPVVLGSDAFVQTSFGLAPEGDFLFYTNLLEPPTIVMATRESGAWELSPSEPPAGIFAGVPSARLFGARRVLVRVGQEGVVEGDIVRDVQEYVEDGDGWRAVGSRFAMPGAFAPNLTANAMTAVFVDIVDGLAVVAIATRDSVDDAFEGRTVIFRAEPEVGIRAGQVRGDTIVDKQCDTLFVAVGNELRRYDR